jgi:predicted acyl esterase
MKYHVAAGIAAGILMFVMRPLLASPYAVIYERNVATVMRDGTILRADIYRPDADGKFPVLVQRTPYDKNSGVEFGLKGAARGYVVIIQDVREGRNVVCGAFLRSVYANDFA